MKNKTNEQVNGKVIDGEFKEVQQDTNQEPEEDQQNDDAAGTVNDEEPKKEGFFKKAGKFTVKVVKKGWPIGLAIGAFVVGYMLRGNDDEGTSIDTDAVVDAVKPALEEHAEKIIETATEAAESVQEN